MAERHWLDPLARRLLIASGQLPRPARRSNADRPATQPSHGVEDGQVHGQAEAIERDLLHLQLKLRPGRPLLDSEEVRRAAALGWRFVHFVFEPLCGPAAVARDQGVIDELTTRLARIEAAVCGGAGAGASAPRALAHGPGRDVAEEEVKS